MAKRRARRRVERKSGTAPLAAQGIGDLRYIETSALLSALLEGDAAAQAALEAEGRYVTSALTFAEAGRAIVRARTAGRLTPQQEQAAVLALRTCQRRTFTVDVTSGVLDRVARPFPVEPVRTLDAMHLATAELLGEPPQLITIVTRDVRVRDNARALGYLCA